MSSARRPLLTATAAATLLGALWFVPSANATQDSGAREQSTEVGAAATVHSATGADATRLADTGSFDSTPYVVGGTLFLTVGAGFVVYSVRRERLGF
ncbi:hypothetical protein JS756_14865 [Streptomyces actuosus]|uniref:Cell wall protein n=1 Tax=Streptomyces actuosus TaxID=1885 RepID=A0ABS2VQL6_STRAS|nr:hypothetical protein [Streptomyces actuosus]MBN0045368.1 hypothetical protein [Streptomyces actuosus]